MCGSAHLRAEPRRHVTCTHAGVLNFFMLAPHGLPLQLTPTKDGCQLSLHHSSGVIIERFGTVSSALRRAERLNDLLSASPRPVRRLTIRKAKAPRRCRR